MAVVVLIQAPVPTQAAESEARPTPGLGWVAILSCTPIVVPIPWMVIGPSLELCHFMLKVSDLFDA